VTGVYLISAEGDFYEEEAVLLNRHKFHFAPRPLGGLRAASFVTVGEGPFCLHVDTDGGQFNVIIKGSEEESEGEALNSLSLCKWTLPEAKLAPPAFVSRYARIFDGSREQGQFEWGKGAGSCPGSGKGESLGLVKGPKKKRGKKKGGERDPFSIIDPLQWRATKNRGRMIMMKGANKVRLNNFN
jgi:hypothetical protein